MHCSVLRVALSVACLAALSPLEAQARPRADRIGLIAGVNLASIKQDNAGSPEGLSSRTGLMAGVYDVHAIAGDFDIQAELLYSQKGSSFSDTGIEAQITLKYIEIPVLLRYNLPVLSSDFRPHIYIGPAFSYRTSCSGSSTYQGTTISGDCRAFGETTTSNGGDEPARYDIGGVIGGGLSFNMNGRAVTVGARYERGFGNLDATPNPQTTVTNRVVTLLASIDLSRGY